MIPWEWLAQCELWLYDFNVELEETLVEYEGPHLAIFSDSNKHKYFGIFCDFINKRNRWMLAPITGAESIAIQTGTVTLIDALKKRTIWFCDFDDSFQSANTWHASFDRIPSLLLPKKGQLLPSFAQRPISDFVQLTQNDAIIKLDGRNIVQNSIPFREFGKFLLYFQDYWDRLSRSSIVKIIKDVPSLDPNALASLSFCAASEGSINIHFKATSNFNKSNHYFKSTINKLASIEESGVPKKVATELGHIGLKNANNMYSTLHSTGVDLLIATQTKCYFIGSEKAGRLSHSINKSKKQKTRNLILRGYFCAGRNKKNTHSFEFIDEFTGKAYKGKLGPLVWKYTAISVGPTDYYEVEIETYEKRKVNQPVELAYLLLRAEKIMRPLIIENNID